VNLLTRVRQELGELAGYLYRLPEIIIEQNRLRRQQAGRDVEEAERLDRIRNPHKYRCQ
jgi:hypothetical protein